MAGMVLAVGVTLVHPEVRSYTWVLAGLGAGALVGTILALRISMTAMPQLVAALHSFVGLAAVLVALGTFLLHSETDPVLLTEIVVGSFIGAITFSGSLVAFGNLQEILGSSPLVFKGQHLLNLALGLVMVGFSVHFVTTAALSSFLIATSIALLLGFTLVLPIGG